MPSRSSRATGIYGSADHHARLELPPFGMTIGRNAACVHVHRGDATGTGAGNCAVSALPRSKPSHRLVCTEPQVIRGFVTHGNQRSAPWAVRCRSTVPTLLRFAAVTRWAAGRA